MSFKNWKEITELVALIAVVASLMAIVFELRLTQDSLQASAYQERAFDAINQNAALMANDELMELVIGYQMGVTDLESLSPLQRTKVSLFFINTRADLDNEHFQFEKGFLDPEFYYGETVPRIRIEAPRWRSIFGSEESRPSFKQEVDRILNEK